MTNKQLNGVVNNRIALIKKILHKKGTEYSAPTDDRFITFKIAAGLQQTTPKQALMGMLAKHLASIQHMIQKNEHYKKEVWAEKIGDAINYLILLEAMVYEELDYYNDIFMEEGS